MKGIVLAGGTGSRLYPITRVVNKQLLPVYDKPMIYYPLATLMEGGIRDILIICNPGDREAYLRLLGDGRQWGVTLSYRVQERPDGLPQAFVLGREFIGRNDVTLILGDNIFFGAPLAPLFRAALARRRGATVFAYPVSDPQRYGVVELDAAGRPRSVVEKPAVPPSNLAITGLYVCDNAVVDIAAGLRPSARGETEITDVHRAYLERGELHVAQLGRGVAWLDTGTPASLAEASSLLHALEVRQGIKVACLEEVAYQQGFISYEALRSCARQYGSSDYGRYVGGIPEEDWDRLAA